MRSVGFESRLIELCDGLRTASFRVQTKLGQACEVGATIWNFCCRLKVENPMNSDELYQFEGFRTLFVCFVCSQISLVYGIQSYVL